jgi:WD40 repeat protein
MLDLKSGSILWNAKEAVGHTASFTKNNELVACGGLLDCVTYLNANTGVREKHLKTDSQPVTLVRHSADGRVMLTGGRDVTGWDMKSEKQLVVWPGVTVAVEQMSFSHKGNFIAAGGNDDTVSLWHYGSDNLVKPIRLPLAGPLSHLAFDPASSRFIAHTPKQLTFFAPATDSKPTTSDLPFVTKLFAVSPVVPLVALGREGGVELRDVRSGKIQRTLEFNAKSGYVPEVTGLEMSAHRPWLAIATTHRRSPEAAAITVWNISKGNQITSLKGHGEGDRKLRFSANGFLASLGRARYGPVHLTALETEPKTHQLAESKVTFQCIDFSVDGRLLFVGADNGKVYVYETWTGQLVTSIRGDGAEVKSIRCSPDGKLFATGSINSTILLWPSLQELWGAFQRKIQRNWPNYGATWQVATEGWLMAPFPNW